MVCRLTLLSVVVLVSSSPLAARVSADSTGRAARQPSVDARGPELDETFGASVNQLGLQNTLGLRWTRPLTRSRHPLLADAHLRAGLTHTLTPSYTRLAAWFELSPLSILDLRAGVEPAAYFGSFGSLMSFDTYGDDFGDSARSARRAEAHAGTGTRLFLAPTLKGRLGSFVFASSASWEWWRSSAAGPLYYEPARDTLLRSDGDRLLTLSTVIARRQPLGGGGEITCGLKHDLTEVFAAAGNRSQKLGVFAARQLAARHLSLPARSVVAVQVAYYLEDPIRKGQLGAAVGVSLGRRR